MAAPLPVVYLPPPSCVYFRTEPTPVGYVTTFLHVRTALTPLGTVTPRIPHTPGKKLGTVLFYMVPNLASGPVSSPSIYRADPSVPATIGNKLSPKDNYP